MNQRARELIKYGELCGFVLSEEILGSGHYSMTHPNGSNVTVAATPGDLRGDDNTRAAMRRLSGVTPDVGRRAGKFRKGFRLEKFVPADDRVESVSAQYASLARDFDRLNARIKWLQDNGSMDEARAPLRDLLVVEERIKALGRTVPMRTFRVGVS